MNFEQLSAARAALWHQNNDAILTLEAASDWLAQTGLCSFAPQADAVRRASAGIPVAPAPTFLEAVLGERLTEATDAEALKSARETAESLLVRLVAAGDAVLLPPAAVEIANIGSAGMIAATGCFAFAYALRGDRNWRQPPSIFGMQRVSPLSVDAWKQLDMNGPVTAFELGRELGREVTEAATLRAMGELWSQLRVLPIPGADGRPTKWETAGHRHKQALQTAAGASSAMALSALISLYLQSVIAASEEEIAAFLQPLAPANRVLEVVHGLQAARQLDPIVCEGQRMVHVTGTLPEFADPNAVVADASGSDGIEAAGEVEGESLPGLSVQEETDEEAKPKRKIYDRKPAGGERKPYERKPYERKPMGDRKPFGEKKPYQKKAWQPDEGFRSEGGASRERSAGPRSAGPRSSGPRKEWGTGGGGGFKKREGGFKPPFKSGGKPGFSKPGFSKPGFSARPRATEGAGEEGSAPTEKKFVRGKFPPRRFDEKKPYDRKPAGRSFSDRGGDSRPPRSFESRGPRSSEGRPPRRFDERPARSSEGRPPRRFDERPPRSSEGRPPRSFDGKPPRSAGGFKSGGAKPGGFKSGPGGFKSGGFKPRGDKPFGSKPEYPKSSFSKRPSTGPRKEFGDKKFGDKKFGDKKFGAGKSFGKSGGKSFGKPPAGGKKFSKPFGKPATGAKKRKDAGDKGGEE